MFIDPDAIEPFLQQDPTEALLSEEYQDDKDILLGHTSDEAYVLMMKDFIFKPPINYAQDIEIGLPLHFGDIDFQSEVGYWFEPLIK